MTITVVSIPPCLGWSGENPRFFELLRRNIVLMDFVKMFQLPHDVG